MRIKDKASMTASDEFHHILIMSAYNAGYTTCQVHLFIPILVTQNVRHHISNVLCRRPSKGAHDQIPLHRLPPVRLGFEIVEQRRSDLLLGNIP